MPRKRAPRRGLVLGAGGVLGSAWTIGALRAYQIQTGEDVRSFDLIVGTSAGSVVAALLSLGVGVDTMADSERGLYQPGTPVLDYRDLGASLPPPPRMRMGSPRLLTSAVLHPRRMTPMVALAALLPQGRGTISAVGELVASAARQHAASATSWPRRLRVVAMDFDTGGRVLFGADGAPRATVAQAVMASCAIPGWYAPITVGGRRFVDGGTRSPTSLDLCVEAGGLDEILVLAPACAFDCDRPRHPVAIAERQLRRAGTRRLSREIALAEAAGTKVSAVSPGREDLEVMGGNVMDVTRRAAVFETALRTCAAAFADLAPSAAVSQRAASVVAGTRKAAVPAVPAVPAAASGAADVTRLTTTPTRRTGPARRPTPVREEPDLAG